MKIIARVKSDFPVKFGIPRQSERKGGGVKGYGRYGTGVPKS